MRKIRDVLRLRHGAALSHDEIARALRISKGVVAKYLRLAKAHGLGWPLPADLGDEALEALLYPSTSQRELGYAVPDYAQVHQELKRKGVTLQLLWQEYRQEALARAYRVRAEQP